MTKTHCSNCLRNSRLLVRGLCKPCRRNPADVAEPSATPGGIRSPISPFIAGRLPARPTKWPPGSPEKMAVMRSRAMAGEAIWHPDDATEYDRYVGDPRENPMPADAPPED